MCPDPGCFALVKDLSQGGPRDEFFCKCPPPEAQTSLQMAGNRELERDVNRLEHDRQLCRPMQGSASPVPYVKKVPTRTGPRCAPSACKPC